MCFLRKVLINKTLKFVKIMKQNLLTIVVFSLFLLGSCNRIKETVITGQIIGNVDNVIFSNPNQATSFTELRDTIIFIENSENINTLAELIKPMRGRKIYIAVWATSCRPCIAQFNYSEALRKILIENDIQMLYISLDGGQRHEQWQRLVQYHNLKGWHIRVNGNLFRDLRDIFDDSGGRMSIPWYILIDENGNVLQRHAKRPSQIVSGGNIFGN